MQKMISTTATLLAGAVFATVVILACGNGSPADADAGTCDCSEAEPPLAGRIVMVEDKRNSGTAAFQAADAVCESAIGAKNRILLGGGCWVNDGDANDLTLYNAGIADEDAADPLGGSYSCHWRNPTEITIDEVVARAICLVPAASE